MNMKIVELDGFGVNPGDLSWHQATHKWCYKPFLRKWPQRSYNSGTS